MKYQSSVRKGFTLIELIAVIVVLGILVGVALPTYYDHSAKSKAAATKGALGGVRAGVATWYANKAINGTPAYPTLAQLTTAGQVMQEQIPPNPYNADLITVKDEDTNWVAGNPPVDSTTGWAYDKTAGKFWANSSSVNEHKW